MRTSKTTDAQLIWSRSLRGFRGDGERAGPAAVGLDDLVDLLLDADGVSDGAAPVVTCENPPFNRVWDTDDMTTVQFSVSDGSGSGVLSQSAIINKFETATGTRATFDGDAIGMYLHYPDTVTVTVTAEDFVGNSGDTPCNFELEATPDSLLNNLARAQAEGDVPNPDVYNGLLDKLHQVKKQHNKGKHATEWNALGAFIDQLEGQRGKGIDLIVANRFIAYAEEIIAEGR